MVSALSISPAYYAAAREQFLAERAEESLVREEARQMRRRVFSFLVRAPLLIVRDREVLRRNNDHEFFSYVERHFTDVPPPCAKTPPPVRWTLLFRTS